ncbi:hypothetical protein Tco_1167994 [Tanacetum coccineum]
MQKRSRAAIQPLVASTGSIFIKSIKFRLWIKRGSSSSSSPVVTATSSSLTIGAMCAPFAGTNRVIYSSVILSLVIHFALVDQQDEGRDKQLTVWDGRHAKMRKLLTDVTLPEQ